MYYVKYNKTRQEPIKRILTVNSCFALLVTHQHCVAKICNASPGAKAINCGMTVHYFKSRTLNSIAPRNTRCRLTCFGAQ